MEVDAHPALAAAALPRGARPLSWFASVADAPIGVLLDEAAATPSAPPNGLANGSPSRSVR